MDNHFSNLFSFIQKNRIQFKKLENTKKRGDQLKNKEKSLSNWFLNVQKRENHFESEKTLKKRKLVIKWKLTFQTDFHLFKNLEISFKSEKTQKRENQFKKWKITFQTDFCLFKKGEISLKSEKHGFGFSIVLGFWIYLSWAK